MGSAVAIEEKRSTEPNAATSGKRIWYLLGAKVIFRTGPMRKRGEQIRMLWVPWLPYIYSKQERLCPIPPDIRRLRGFGVPGTKRVRFMPFGQVALSENKFGATIRRPEPVLY
jgi:hypothetical protein